MPTSTRPTEHPTWRFGLAVYARAGVKQTCLQLQEAHDVDVAVVLALLWFARAYRRVPHRRAMLAALEDAAPLRAEVREVRRQRKQLGAQARKEALPAPGYPVAKARELMAERRLMETLGTALLGHSEHAHRLDPAVAARQTMEAYTEAEAMAPALPLLLRLADLAG